jgi:DNA-binding CsgD family transcriptional regulator
VFKLVAEGLSSREIANLLGIAVKTVTVHRAGAMKKLGIHNQRELIKYAIRKSLINLAT